MLKDNLVQDFHDTSTPLKHFTDSVLCPPADPTEREANFEDKSENLVKVSDRIVTTAKLVATGNATGNKKTSEAILAAAGQIESLTPQLVNAGRIRMVYPENKAADEHFENLRKQYTDTVARNKALVDEATDTVRFIGESARAMKHYSDLCEDAISKGDPNRRVENTTAIARLANRVLQLCKQEAENSEDPRYISVLNISSEQLQVRVSPMVHQAKAVALNINDEAAIQAWRQQNSLLLDAVNFVHSSVRDNVSNGDEPPLPPYPDMANLSLDGDYGDTPPRPPPPGGHQYNNMFTPPRPPPPDSTDDESENPFDVAPTPSQGPIMMAAHDLHQEVRQWSSKDNDIIAAAKKMAFLMARLSKSVREEEGSKRELINISKSIAEASDEVSRLAKELARECTDKRMRTNLLQVCERIPTIGTQLKILSTVKVHHNYVTSNEKSLCIFVW